MPGFLFAAGFSYRLTMLRRIPRDGAFKAYSHAIWRGLGLVAVSLAMYGFNGSFVESWSEVNPTQVWDFWAGMIKANLWETLAVIGVSQLVVLPFVAKRTRVVALGMLGLLIAHILPSLAAASPTHHSLEWFALQNQWPTNKLLRRCRNN